MEKSARADEEEERTSEETPEEQVPRSGGWYELGSLLLAVGAFLFRLLYPSLLLLLAAAGLALAIMALRQRRGSMLAIFCLLLCLIETLAGGLILLISALLSK